MATTSIGSSGVTFPDSTTQSSAAKILQVVQSVSNTLFSTTTSNTDITGLSVSITPKFSTSNILVIYNVIYGNSSAQPYSGINLICNGTAVPVGTSSGGYTGFTTPAVLANPSNPENETRSYSFSYIHSPATTSSVTYKLQVGTIQSSRTVYINSNASNAGLLVSGVSQILVMEVAP